MAERLLPIAAMEKLLKEAGAHRVSDEAKAALKHVLEQEAKEIAERAAAMAQHAGRRTIHAEDVRLALSERR